MAGSDDRSAEKDLPEPWSPQRKTEVVLRLIKGEDLGAVRSRLRLTSWKSGGEYSLRAGHLVFAGAEAIPWSGT